MPAPILRVIGSAAAFLTDPAPPDLCDIGGLCGQLALTIACVGKGLGNAYANGDDQHKARDTALETLLRAHADLGRLVNQLAEWRE